jgi:hypothetical protein
VNLQLDHFSEMKPKPKPERSVPRFWMDFGPERLGLFLLTQHKQNFCRFTLEKKTFVLYFFCESRLSQRVAMDDLASYFVEERSKVR